MPQPYEHLHLMHWPFPIVPSRATCTFIAGRQQLRTEIDLLLTALSRRDTASIHLFWAWFGAGKTHSLFYIANLSERLNAKSTSMQLCPVYSEFPKATRSFVDLYRSFMENLDVNTLIDAYLELSTGSNSNRLRADLAFASPDLANALQALMAGTEADQAVALRWLRAESLPVSEFRRVGVAQKITSSEEAVRILRALIGLLNTAAQSQGRPGSRVMWMLDEFQRIEACPPRIRDEVNTGLHSSFNACPTGFSLFLAFSGKPSEDRLPTWLSPEIRDRIGRTRVMLLPPMMPSEALVFVKEVLAQHRVPEYADSAPYFPFSEDACAFIIREIEKQGELKPRSVMHAFNAVLQEADPGIESGKIKIISPEYAKQVLADYAVLKDTEEL